MVRLNKTQLTTDQFDALFTQLNEALGNLSTSNTNVFLSELLGKEERMMLAKRLAIIILLVEGKSLYKISDILKVSPTTAEKLKWKLEKGEFNHILIIMGKNKKEYFSILETLDSILHLGGILPHYNGIERY